MTCDMWSFLWGEEAIRDRTPHLWLNAGWWVQGSVFCCLWFRHVGSMLWTCETRSCHTAGKAILVQASPFQGETCNQINLTKNTIHDTKTQIRPLQGTVDQASWHECGCTWSNQVMGHGAWSERKYPCNYKCRPPTSHEHASMLIMSLCFHGISLIHRIHCIQMYSRLFSLPCSFCEPFLCVFFVPRQVFGGANGVDIYLRILAKTTRSQGAHPRSSDLWSMQCQDVEGKLCGDGAERTLLKIQRHQFWLLGPVYISRFWDFSIPVRYRLSPFTCFFNLFCFLPQISGDHHLAWAPDDVAEMSWGSTSAPSKWEERPPRAAGVLDV